MLPLGIKSLNEIEIYNSVQHKMIEHIEHFISGKCDNLEAIKQSIYKIINTQRYKYIIYSWNYGIELSDLFGKPIKYVIPIIEHRIKEALIVDDRINDVDNFIFDKYSKKILTVSFDVYTIFGAVPIVNDFKFK